MTDLTGLGQRFLEVLNQTPPAANSSEMIGIAIVETVEPLIRFALDWSDSGAIATKQHVDDLTADILRALGRTPS